MIDKAYNQLLENCRLNETDSQDIKGTQDVLLNLVQEKYNTSLLWQICDVLPIKGTLGRVFVQKRNFNENKFEVIKKDIVPETYRMETGFTREVLQDMENLFGKSAYESVSEIFRGLSDYQENMYLMDFIDNNAVIRPDLVLEGDVDNDIQLITTTVAEYIIAMNHMTFKTLEGWCILPWELASLFLGYWMPFRSEGKDDKSDFLYLGKFGKIDYYIDPRKSNELNAEFTDDYDEDYTIGQIELPDHIYVGLKSEKVPGYGSLIFAPYQYDYQEVQDPDTGEIKMFLFNRYGLELSPFHNILEQKSMLYKFKVYRATTP